jgi:hypothetical protein
VRRLEALSNRRASDGEGVSVIVSILLIINERNVTYTA